MKIKRNQKGLALKGSKGFTLIEVVLVLAIGGLIFLLAFLAFQQVSRNRRDTQRRNDAGRVLAELQNYASDNGGFPTATVFSGFAAWQVDGTADNATKVFYKDYMGGASFKDPNKNIYSVYALDAPTLNSLLAAAGSAAPADRGKIIYHGIGALCDSGNKVQAAGAGNVAVIIGLESGFVCRDNK